MRRRDVAIRTIGRDGGSRGITITVLTLIIAFIITLITLIFINIAGFIDSCCFDVVGNAASDELSGHVAARTCLSLHHC